ncbi:DUF992 domain-containing protein [Oricola sp.]|uniref:DUF992 domain-containing protein n=1 Tax=Oricola sp. TaxID=1979950 RepID=UPI0025E6B29B|nr:DUF992 domain-containing protein [Oricola sp.]MCI5074862.1 DUF992 domain-containing protein [Oricola sp.]
MKLSKTIASGALALTAALVAGTATAQETDATPADDIERVEIGILDCVVEGGPGFVFGSTKDLSCIYRPSGDGAQEPYFGAISKYGVDIGTTDVTYMTWAVLAPTTDDFRPGALAGNYYGVTAEATAGAGVGVNALLGGSSETIALQPISVTGQTGLNFALAVSELELRSSAD